MDPSTLNIGVMQPLWTDSLGGRTPTLAEVLAFARHAELAAVPACLRA